jgi:hypothetical protein
VFGAIRKERRKATPRWRKRLEHRIHGERCAHHSAQPELAQQHIERGG